MYKDVRYNIIHRSGNTRGGCRYIYKKKNASIHYDSHRMECHIVMTKHIFQKISNDREGMIDKIKIYKRKH